MKNVYGYISNGAFVETGLSERGAKVSATKQGLTLVGYRSYINNMFIQTATKVAGKWSEHKALCL